MNNWKRDNFFAAFGAILVILLFIFVSYLETNW